MWGRAIAAAARPRRAATRKPGDQEARPAPDLVDRNFTAAGPNQLWIADITFVPTTAGFLYLAVVLNAWSRKVVGWAMATHLRTERVLDALEMAVGQRRPQDVIHHSDQGSQGAFKWSSQRLGGGGCDGGSAVVGSGFAGEAEIAGATGGRFA